MTTPQDSRPRRSAAMQSSAALLGIAALTLLLVALVLPSVYQRRWASRIYPGVHVAGINVGGMLPSEAGMALASAGLDPSAPVSVSIDDERNVLPKGTIWLDVDGSIEDAAGIGREGGRIASLFDMLAARFRHPIVTPHIVHDDAVLRGAILALTTEFDRPALDAMLTFEGTTVRMTEPQTGRTIDQDAAFETLIVAADAGVWPIRDVSLPVVIAEPVVTDADQAFKTASWLLDGALELRAFNRSWSTVPERIAPMLGSSVIDNRIAVTLDNGSLQALLAPVTESVSRTAQSARFHFDDESGELVVVEPGRTGRTVNVERTAQRLLDLPNPGPRKLQIGIDFVAPDIPDDVTAEELGIRELMHEEVSFFRGSSADRVHNIGLAASKFDGALIPPNSVFSFNDQIGDISEESGYKETLIILDGATADGVGGGVCQVSTTLFRSAFWTGLPIVSRTAHGYRVGYYEQGAPMGLDATVYRPILDLKIENDTPAWMLIETETNTSNMSLTFRVYGTDPGRTVEMEGPIVSAETEPPPPAFEVDPDLPPGASNTIELARNGASVTVTRVIAGGDTGPEPVEEVFYSVYRPTGALTAVGPTPGPPPGAPLSGAVGVVPVSGTSSGTLP